MFRGRQVWNLACCPEVPNRIMYNYDEHVCMCAG